MFLECCDTSTHIQDLHKGDIVGLCPFTLHEALLATFMGTILMPCVYQHSTYPKIMAFQATIMDIMLNLKCPLGTCIWCMKALLTQTLKFQ